MTHATVNFPPAPAGASPEAQVQWLEQMAACCRSAGGATFARLADALERSREGLLEGKGDGALRQQGRQLAATLQALGLWTLVQQLAQLHAELLGSLAELGESDPGRAALQKEALATERTLDALADAYDALRAGDTSKLQALGARL